ncbi:MAG TPA: hypothetical protein VL307_04465, partial [Chitinophagaceae bacterium]|nr:hypothetical protein [Chitinophagaceae bacterium]
MQHQIRVTGLVVFLMMSMAGLTFAQQQLSPFRSIGKQSEVIDISHGKYQEIIEKDSLERIGTVVINRNTRKITRLIEENNTNEFVYKGSEQGRFFSIDPLTTKFPYYSPYQFAGNTPIWASDLDGLEPNFTYKNNGITGFGLLDPETLSNIPRHSTVLTLGRPGKQF